MRSFPSSAEVAREAELEKQELAMKRKRSAHEVRVYLCLYLYLYMHLYFYSIRKESSCGSAGQSLRCLRKQNMKLSNILLQNCTKGVLRISTKKCPKSQQNEPINHYRGIPIENLYSSAKKSKCSYLDQIFQLDDTNGTTLRQEKALC